MALDDFERGKQLGQLPPLPHDPGHADFQRGQAAAEAQGQRQAEANDRVRRAIGKDWSRGYKHAFKVMTIQTVFWTSLIGGAAALIAWRLHQGRGQVERSALGAGGLVLAFCLFIIVVTTIAYTFANHFRVVILVVLGALLVVAGAMAVGVVPKVW
jgi:hypothetical protein